jgi:hypothetical protein
MAVIARPASNSGVEDRGWTPDRVEWWWRGTLGMLLLGTVES